MRELTVEHVVCKSHGRSTDRREIAVLWSFLVRTVSLQVQALRVVRQSTRHVCVCMVGVLLETSMDFVYVVRVQNK